MSRRRPSLPAFLLLGLTLAAACEPAQRDDDAGPRDPEPATDREMVDTERAPAAIGPYSQAIRAGNTLYLAGQLGMSPATGELVEGGIRAETRQAMENLGAVLDAAGFSFEDVVQTQVFLADLAEFEAMNEVYGDYFGPAPPARATVQAARIPRDARVEILMTAVKVP